MNALLHLALQQAPVVVDLTRQQPEPTPDIAIYTILGMFAMAGVLLAVAATGAVLVASGMLIYKRWRDAANPDAGAHTHTRLRI
jgi:predicted RND superfamily exporter protein